MSDRTFVPAHGDAPYDSIVSELERAELAARERRLIAESEADRLRAAAVETVAGIEADLPARSATALAELRSRHVEAAEAEIAALGTRLTGDSADSADPTPVPDAAVDLLVAAVLSEPEG